MLFDAASVASVRWRARFSWVELRAFLEMRARAAAMASSSMERSWKWRRREWAQSEWVDGEMYVFGPAGGFCSLRTLLLFFVLE